MYMKIIIFVYRKSRKLIYYICPHYRNRGFLYFFNIFQDLQVDE